MKTRVKAQIHGRVQGVGFRPTVYRYARQLGLAGYVCNGPQGVTLEVEGDDLNVGLFFDRLNAQPPRQAVIDGFEKQVLGVKGYERFEVVESEPASEPLVAVSPDLALCEDCRREVADPANRRHGYVFTNCTNCGPRFTIINDLPYDRATTSMAAFTMCPDCAREYRDPSDRRFHAQPNACPVCGPQLQLLIPGGETMKRASLPAAIELLKRGQIVAVKGLGGYHLACDALSREAVARLRQRKHRADKPFAVMFRDLPAVKKYCVVSEVEEAELLSAAHPIVILQSNAPGLQRSISPDTSTLGAFLPYTPLHVRLLEHFEALVMTSANISDEPIISRETELPRITGIADAILTHNRGIAHKCDDSVIRVDQGQRQFLRRARGFVPNAIRLAGNSEPILAVGGELKNTFCLVRAGQAFVSQHLGDLKDHRTYEAFTHEITEWQRLLQIKPAVIAHDWHPAYLSTKFAQKFANVTLLPVQHHHAHIASVMAEHDLHDFVIGVALDGTGYGTDGTIWGGEILVADRADFERAAHFKAYPLPGGDKAIEEPWRMAASVLLTEGLAEPTRRTDPLRKMIAAGFNSPLTSSAGRLFDAVAAILGLCDAASYEAQAAIRLEAVADPEVISRYRYNIALTARPWQLDFAPTLAEILADKRAGKPVSEIAARFHNTVAAAVVQTCRFIRGQRDLNTVALSGGVFQNALLLRRILTSLQLNQFKVFTNTRVPPNDGGLALGQAAVAAARCGVRQLGAAFPNHGHPPKRQQAAALQRTPPPCA
jgi:hydrogenase maturation protein HypF